MRDWRKFEKGNLMRDRAASLIHLHQPSFFLAFASVVGIYVKYWREKKRERERERERERDSKKNHSIFLIKNLSYFQTWRTLSIFNDKSMVMSWIQLMIIVIVISSSFAGQETFVTTDVEHVEILMSEIISRYLIGCHLLFVNSMPHSYVFPAIQR